MKKRKTFAIVGGPSPELITAVLETGGPETQNLAMIQWRLNHGGRTTY